MHIDSRQWAEEFGYLLGTKWSVRCRKRNIVVNNETLLLQATRVLLTPSAFLGGACC
jgi:hypothetical protein